MVMLAMGSLVIALLNMAVPFVLKYVTDTIVEAVSGDVDFPVHNILWFAAALFVISFVTSLLNNFIGYNGDVLAMRLKQQLSNLYYEHLLKLPQSYYDTEIAGKIINRLNRAITNITRFINVFSNNLLQMLVTVILSIFVMFYYNWMIGALIVFLFPTYIWVTGLTSGKWQRYEADKNGHYDIASGRFNEVISQMRLVKSFGSEKREYRNFANHFGSMLSITKNQSLYWHKMDFIRNVILVIVYTTVYGILFLEAVNGKITIGDLVLLLTLIQQVTGPLSGMSFFIDMYQRAAANSKDYIEAMNIKPEAVSTSHKSLNVKKADISFSNVDFRYGQDDKVLHDITFNINPGKKLALVGESGGGKTTITNLLMGLYKPIAGSVKINGTDISKVSLPSLRKSIATVFQDSGLFSGTIRENIAYGRPSASDEEIIEAAKIANAYDFIFNYEKGLETEIGERGVKLSGGQKQRISIARAVLKDAPILILDEATSSLDSRSEVRVQEALDRLMKNRTVLIIAHRLSTIADVDTIVTLDAGQIDEVGSPSKLAKTDGLYAQLLNLQKSSSEKAKRKLRHYDLSS